MLRELLSILPEDLESLVPGKLVNGRAISAFLRIVERRSRCNTNLPQVWSLDSELLSDWQKGGWEKTRRRVRGVILVLFDLVLVPVHLPHVGSSGHWALIAVEPKLKRITAYDPYGLRRGDEMRHVLEFMRSSAQSTGQQFITDQWERIETPAGVARQDDEVSCGAFVCAYAEKLARRSPLVGFEIRAREARQNIAAVLRRGKFDNENFSLLECGMETYKRFAGPSVVCSPLVTIDICSPEGETLEYKTQADPLLAALNEAIEDQTGRELFAPPLKIKTPRSCRTPSSPCLSLCTSEIEEDTGPAMEVADFVPERKEEEPMEIDDAPAPAPTPVQPKPNERQTPSKTTQPKKTLARPIRKPAVRPCWRPLPRPHWAPPQVQQPYFWIGPERRPFSVPLPLQHRLRTLPETPRPEDRNRRWRIYRPDGSRFRIRPHKLMQQDFCY